MSAEVPREKALFCEALEIADPEQRRQFLDQACGADKTLRAQVERLLALSQTAGDFFSECAPALEADAGDADQVLSAAASALEPEIPETKRIGPYKLLQKLGEGGYGVVYMADQEQPIRRRVALKIIKLGMDTRNVIARFEAERQALALMDHPNIARVLDAGATETGRPFFVMELVYGVKITEYCDQNRVGMKERLELFIQVCNAVQHAHQKGIIHRDLKPSNIMVTMHDGVPVPKVIDFGIAKATEQRLTDKTLFTSYAQLMGTPAYMSPEQMELSGLNLDTRSDIYSLGVLLYELLTSRTPFDTADLLKLGVDELRRTVREQEPLSPSAKLQTLNNEELAKTARRLQVEAPRLVSQLRGDLDWIVLKCLEKDRTRRYETANGVAMDIQRYLQGEPVLARPASQWYRMQKLARKNRVVFLAGAAAVAALVLGTLVSTLMFLRERDARTSEERLRKDAEVREKASHILLLVTQRRFEEADQLAANVPLNKPSIEIAAELRALGDWHALNGRWPEAAARFQSLLKVNQIEDVDLIAADHLRLAAALLKSGNRDGYEQFRQAQVARLGLTNIASEYWTFKIGLLLPPHPNMLQWYALGGEAVEKKFPSREEMRPNPAHGVQWAETLALLDYRRGRFSQAIDWGYRYEKLGILTGARVTKICLIKAMSNWQLGQYRTALVDWIEAYELIQAKLEQGLDLGISRSAGVFPGIGAPEELESPWYDWVNAGLLMRESDEVIAQSEHMLDSRPEPDVVSGDSVTSLARALGDWHAIRGQWEKARKRFEQVRHAASDQRGSADHLCSGMAALKLGDETGFLRLRDEALHQFKDVTDIDAAETVMKLSLLRPLGETTVGALEPFVQVLERTVAGAGPIKKGTTTSASWDLMLLGLLEYRRSNYAQAMEWCRRSLDTSTFMPLPTVMDRVILAMSFHKLGDAAAARSELGQAKSPVMGGMNRGFDKWHWHEWVYARLLLQEAEGLIPQPPLPASSAALQ